MAILHQIISQPTSLSVSHRTTPASYATGKLAFALKFEDSVMQYKRFNQANIDDSQKK
jgi:hypothetical protein